MRLDPHDNTAKDYRRARDLRNNASHIENKLWGVLREAAKGAGYKFRRQQPIHPFIVDFVCMQARLVIELDGDSHDTRQQYDKNRDEKLKQMGFTIMRFPNDDVIQNAESVAIRIIEQTLLLLNSPLPDPPRKGEGILSQFPTSGQSHNA